MGQRLHNYIWLVIKTALPHSFHVTHAFILALIISAGVVTYFDQRVEVMVEPHGWVVATCVLAGVIGVRLLLAPYWIWRDDQKRLAMLTSQVASESDAQKKLAEKNAAIDDIAQEIAWAINNLVNPNTHPGSPANPASAIASFEIESNAWYKRVSKKLENRIVFTQGDQIHFDHLGFIPVAVIWHSRLDHLFAMLKVKLERLTEIEHRARERK
jgi:hypothetical protein